MGRDYWLDWNTSGLGRVYNQVLIKEPNPAVDINKGPGPVRGPALTPKYTYGYHIFVRKISPQWHLSWLQ